MAFSDEGDFERALITVLQIKVLGSPYALSGFINGKSVSAESLGWMKCEHMGKLDETMFVVQAESDSMKGLVEDGEYCVMRKLGGGSMENKTLLIQEYDAAGPEGGGAYALKKFTRRDEMVILVSRNPEVANIVLKDDAEYSTKYRAIAEFKGKM